MWGRFSAVTALEMPAEMFTIAHLDAERGAGFKILGSGWAGLIVELESPHAASAAASPAAAPHRL